MGTTECIDELTFHIECGQVGVYRHHVAQGSCTGRQCLLQPGEGLPVRCNRIEGLCVVFFIGFIARRRFARTRTVCKGHTHTNIYMQCTVTMAIFGVANSLESIGKIAAKHILMLMLMLNQLHYTRLTDRRMKEKKRNSKLLGGAGLSDKCSVLEMKKFADNL